MGSSRRQSCFEHNDRRVPVEVHKTSGTSLGPSSKPHDVRSSHSETRNLCTRLVRKGSHKGDKGKNSTSLFSSLYTGKEEWETTSSHRPVASQLTSGSSHIQDGDCGGDIQKHHGSFVGLLRGHRRRLFPRSHSLGISQIPSLQTKGENIRLPVPPLRVVPGPLGFFKGNQAHKASSSQPSDLYFQLLGRLSHFLHFSGKIAGSLQNCGGTSSEFGLQDKLGEVQSNSFSVNRISRSFLGSSQARTLSSTGQNHSHQRSMPGNESEGGNYQEGVRETDGSTKFCLSIHSSGKTPLATASVVDESTHPSMHQGRPCSSGQGVQRVPSDLEFSGISESSSSNEGSLAFPRLDDRCVPGRMVWDSSSSESFRVMARGSETSLNELEGTKGNPTSSGGISVLTEGENCASSVRQHDSNSMPETSRVSKTCTSSYPDSRDTVILQELEDLPSSSSSEGCLKCPCRPRFSAASHCNRVDSGQADILLAEQIRSPIPGRFVCNEGEHTTSSVCVPLSRPSGTGVQRIQHAVEHLDLHIPHASNELCGRRSEISPGVSRKRSSSCSILAIEGVVSTSPSSVQRVTNPSSPESVAIPIDFEGFSGERQGALLETSRMGSLISSVVNKGASQTAVKVLEHANKDSTKHQYQGTWKKFISFLESEHIPHDKVDIYIVMNFLAHQHVNLGLKYRTIASYKCALAQPLYETFNIRLDNCSLEFFMKGVFNLDPPKPAPMAVWSLDALLTFLVSSHFEPLHLMSLRVITQKFLCLLLLATGRRIDEIGNLSQRYDFGIGGKSVSFHWLPDYVPKHFNKNFQPHLPSFEGLDSDSVEDLKLCPIRTFQIYLGKCQFNPRGSINRPLWSGSSKTLSKLFISTALQAKHFAGDLSEVPIGPHQMRKFAASYSARMVGSSVEGERKVMERMGCKTMSVLKRHYINKIPNISFKMVIPAGTFIPATHFGT